MITLAKLKKLFPSAKPALVAAVVDNWHNAEAAGITTERRIAHFLAQIGTETGGLSTVSENLSYTSAERIFAIFKGPSKARRFKTPAECQPYVRQPKKLGIKVYGGRLGNAPAPSSDGWDYRGGGMMQTTGRENYRKMGFEAQPEALRDPVIAFRTAVREWANRGCNALADLDDIVAVRKKINGGTNGLTEAKAYLAKAKKIAWGANTPPVPIPLKPAPVPTAVLKSDPVTGKYAAERAALTVDTVKQVQTLLREKGYPEVGNSDGKAGDRTRNAILAFQADQSLPLTGKITDELIAQLVKFDGRMMSDERWNAKAKDLKGEPVVDIGQTIKKVGAGLVGISGIGALAEGTSDAESVVIGLGKVQSITDAVLGLSPWLIGAAAGVVAIYFAKRLITKHVQAYREGRAL